MNSTKVYSCLNEVAPRHDFHLITALEHYDIPRNCGTDELTMCEVTIVA